MSASQRTARPHKRETIHVASLMRRSEEQRHKWRVQRDRALTMFIEIFGARAHQRTDPCGHGSGARPRNGSREAYKAVIGPSGLREKNTLLRPSVGWRGCRSVARLKVDGSARNWPSISPVSAVAARR